MASFLRGVRGRSSSSEGKKGKCEPKALQIPLQEDKSDDDSLDEELSGAETAELMSDEDLASLVGCQQRSRSDTADGKSGLSSIAYPFSAEQLAAVEQVRKLCAKELADAAPYEEVVSDRRIMRFLRGHKFDVKVAATMFGNMLSWRKEMNVDRIREHIVRDNLSPEQFPHYGRIMRYYPSFAHHGTAHDGSPLHIEMVGKVTPRKMLSCFSSEEWKNFHIYCCEYNALHLDKLSVEKGKLMRMVLLYDLAGCGPQHLRSKHGWDMIRSTLKITQDNYPESMRECWLINVPKLFTMAWQLLKPCLAERTVRKIQILGSKDYHKMLNQIPATSLPEAYGGSRPNQWPLVFDKKEFKALDEEHRVLEVGKGSASTIDVQLDAASFVVWGYYLKSGDINVSVSTTATLAATEGSDEQETKEDEGEVQISSTSRLDSAGGSFSTASGGTVSLTFDNSFSWMTKKTVNFYVCAVPLAEKHSLDSPRKGRFQGFFSE